MTDLLYLQAQPALLVGGGFAIAAATARLLAQTGAQAVVEEPNAALGVRFSGPVDVWSHGPSTGDHRTRRLEV